MSKFNITRYDIDQTRMPMRRQRSEKPLPTPPKAARRVPMSGDAVAFDDPVLDVRFSTMRAGQYCLEREADYLALMEDGITNLPYARVERASNYGVTVEGVWCCSPMAAAAYILRRWW